MNLFKKKIKNNLKKQFTNNNKPIVVDFKKDQLHPRYAKTNK